MRRHPGASSLAFLLGAFLIFSGGIMYRRTVGTGGKIAFVFVGVGLLGLSVINFKRWLFTNNNPYILLPIQAPPILPIAGGMSMNH